MNKSKITFRKCTDEMFERPSSERTLVEKIYSMGLNRQQLDRSTVAPHYAKLGLDFSMRIQFRNTCIIKILNPHELWLVLFVCLRDTDGHKLYSCKVKLVKLFVPVTR